MSCSPCSRLSLAYSLLRECHAPLLVIRPSTHSSTIARLAVSMVSTPWARMQSEAWGPGPQNVRVAMRVTHRLRPFASCQAVASRRWTRICRSCFAPRRSSQLNGVSKAALQIAGQPVLTRVGLALRNEEAFQP